MGDAFVALQLPIAYDRLPSEVQDKIGELELELSEGDITSKGFEKKVRRLLAPYIHIAASEQRVSSGRSRAENSTKQVSASSGVQNACHDSDLDIGNNVIVSQNALLPRTDFISLNATSNNNAETPRATTPINAAAVAPAIQQHVNGSASATGEKESHYANITSNVFVVNTDSQPTGRRTPIQHHHESCVITKYEVPSPSKRHRSRSRPGRNPAAGGGDLAKVQYEAITKEENRYHSELRHEAVQQALAGVNQSSDVPYNTKRISMPAFFTNGEASSDEDTETSSNVASGFASASSSLRHETNRPITLATFSNTGAGIAGGDSSSIHAASSSSTSSSSKSAAAAAAASASSPSARFVQKLKSTPPPVLPVSSSPISDATGGVVIDSTVAVQTTTTTTKHASSPTTVLPTAPPRPPSSEPPSSPPPPLPTTTTMNAVVDVTTMHAPANLSPANYKKATPPRDLPPAAPTSIVIAKESLYDSPPKRQQSAMDAFAAVLSAAAPPPPPSSSSTSASTPSATSPLKGVNSPTGAEPKAVLRMQESSPLVTSPASPPPLEGITTTQITKSTVPERILVKDVIVEKVKIERRTTNNDAVVAAVRRPESDSNNVAAGSSNRSRMLPAREISSSPSQFTSLMSQQHQQRCIATSDINSAPAAPPPSLLLRHSPPTTTTTAAATTEMMMMKNHNINNNNIITTTTTTSQQQRLLADDVMRQCRVTLPSTTSSSTDDDAYQYANGGGSNSAMSPLRHADYANHQVVIRNSSIFPHGAGSVLSSSSATSTIITTAATTSPTKFLADRPTTTALQQQHSSSSVAAAAGIITAHPRVSTKIQELLQTLKKPKSKPLEEYYEDDEDAELELTAAAAAAADPNAPKPEGPKMTPYQGEALANLLLSSSSPSSQHHHHHHREQQPHESVEAALRHYGTMTPKAPAASVFDLNGKSSSTITYGKLYTRALKVAYALLNRLTPTAATVLPPSVNSSNSSSKGSVSSGLGVVKPGDRVAIVIPNNDPITFMCALYGCLLAGVVPVPIEVPLTRRDAGVQAIGLLLSACGVSVCLTSEKCFRSLPKSDTPSAAAAAAFGGGENQQQGMSNGRHPSGTAFTTQVSSGGSREGILAFKSWPVPLMWCVVENCSKLPRDWQPPPPPPMTQQQVAFGGGDSSSSLSSTYAAAAAAAYIEYTHDRNGAVIGVNVSRNACTAHCRALTSACGYVEGEALICVIDFKREVGLWHAVLCGVYNGIHSMFVPYSLMKVQPASWLIQVTKHKASVAIVKSRDLHWATLAQREHRDVNLTSLRMLLVADGANPWSLTSCDQFISVMQAKGLRSDALCPCAASSEALTVALRRPANRVPHSSGRGILSMSALTYGVVKVERENTLTSLTLQDCGQVLPDARLAVIRIENTHGMPGSLAARRTSVVNSTLTTPVYAELCCSDEVGEICISSTTCGSSYWGLAGLSQQAFNVNVLAHSTAAAAEQQNNNYENGDIARRQQQQQQHYVRTGLLGFLGPNGLVFSCGSRLGLMQVAGRRHNIDDIIATVLAVEPSKFIYRGRIAIFAIRVLRDDRICVIAEQRPNCTEEESFAWMSRVLQAVDKIHQVGVYCLALVPPNQLPKTPLGGINLAETRKRFIDGHINPSNLLLAPHNCISLGPPRQPPPDIGPAAVMVGSIVQGVRVAEAKGRELAATEPEETKYQFIAEILRWRAQATADNNIFTLMNARGVPIGTLTCLQLHKRASVLAAHLLDKAHIHPGDHVALIYPPNIELICAFYACLYAGAIAIPVRPFHPQSLESTLPTVRMTVEVARASAIMTTSAIARILRSSKVATLLNSSAYAHSTFPNSSSGDSSHHSSHHRDSKSAWPYVLETDELAKKKFTNAHHVPHSVESPCYYDFSVSTSGTLAGVTISHVSVTALCRAIKLQCELYPSRYVAVSLDPYSGLGFVLWALTSVYAGHHSILIPAAEVELNASVWLSLVSQYRVRDTFCSCGVMELTTRGLASVIPSLKEKGINLSCLRTCVVVAEERPRVALVSSFCKMFSVLGLSSRAVSTSFGCRVNVAVAVQGASGPDPATAFVDLRALRNGRITLVERGSPHSLCLMESGKLLPGVKIVIADPDTRGQLSDSHLGEIWVASPFNANGYFAVIGCNQRAIDNTQFTAQLTTGDTRTIYARTGCLGFVRRTEAIDSNGEQHDALFVVGALEETFVLRGMRYHPVDIEASVLRADKRICECAVFTWTNLLVVICELDGPENEALNLVISVTNAIIEDHHLIAGIVAIVDPAVVPINSKGEKQRMHLRDSFLADKLDPIYVAYNM